MSSHTKRKVSLTAFGLITALAVTACGGAKPQETTTAPAAAPATAPASEAKPAAQTPAAPNTSTPTATPAPTAPTAPTAPSTTPSTSASATATVTTPAAVGTGDLTVVITMKDYSFEPKEITAKKGQKVIITLKNAGERRHDMALQGPYDGMKSAQIAAGTETTFEFVADKVGTFDFICTLRGHADRGMVGKFIVSE